jgi:hypothetical protein
MKVPFKIWFESLGEDDDAVVDDLYAGPLDDAVIAGSDGRFVAIYERDSVGGAHGFTQLIADAVQQIERRPGCRVQRVGHDDDVSLAEIGRRVGRTREYVRLLARGRRGPGGFPQQLAHHSQPLWSWQAVSEWCVEHGLFDVRVDGEARFVRLLNAALEQRNIRSDQDGDDDWALVEHAIGT